MFFDRLIKVIVIALIGFIIAVNIYFWGMNIHFGGDYKFTGFYTFFKNMERFPDFDYFVQSVIELGNVFTKWSGWKIALAVVTLGSSVVAEFTGYVTQIAICLFIDFFRILIWLLGFFGYDLSSPILQ